MIFWMARAQALRGAIKEGLPARDAAGAASNSDSRRKVLAHRCMAFHGTKGHRARVLRRVGDTCAQPNRNRRVGAGGPRGEAQLASEPVHSCIATHKCVVATQ